MILNKHKIKRLILPVIILVVFVVLGLNLYLGKKLEKYLRRELIERTSEATNGFYSLAFRNLSINLWNGELKIEGIEFKPDSRIFKQWMAIDSLPENYIHGTIDVIDFKGINLIWRTNYKQLHFRKFEIDRPNIKVYNSTFSDRLKKVTKNTSNQTLYDLIKPYINVLSVKTLNLKSADVSYTIADNTAPTVYNLEDVNFNAFDFRLDSNSSTSGKLLYCDNFDFTTNQTQTLLTNKEFSLYTEKILLSTKDSIISIRNIRLLPQEEVWEINKLKPSTYLHGEIKSVGVNGIKFSRENGLNFLTARSFDIDSSEIKIFNISDPIQKENAHKKEKHTVSRDSLVKSLSVYEIISPIFSSVAINHIGIENTDLEYSYTYKDSLETYSLEDFKFNAYDFLVDSIAEIEHGFWYSQNFGFEANSINGIMPTRNHAVSIGHIVFNSTDKSFYLKGISLNPISTKVSKDYIKGSVDSICIEGLDYKKGVSAQLLTIESPYLKYFKRDGSRLNNNKANSKQAVDINDLLSPLLEYISIGKIRVNKGRFAYNDMGKANPINYELDNFNFFATNFLIDENTGKNKPIFFRFDHFGFAFSNFTNHLSSDDYTLSIENGSFSTIKKEFKLQNIAFGSQEHDLSKQSNSKVNFTAARMDLHGFENSIFHIGDSVKIDSVYIDSPHLNVSSIENKQVQKDRKEISAQKKNNLFKRFIVENLLMRNSRIRVENDIDKERIDADLNAISFDNISFDLPNKKVNFDGLKTNDIKVHTKQKEANIDIELTKIALNSFKWDLQSGKGALSMSSFHLINPDIKINLLKSLSKQQKPADFKPENIYQSLNRYFEKLAIDSFNLTNGNLTFDYLNRAGELSNQKLNSLNVGFEGFEINNTKKIVKLGDIQLKMRDLNFPIDNGFYNLHIGDIDLNKNRLEVSKLALTSPYPKMEFSYKHPRHDDWFDVKVDKIAFTDIDIPFYLKNKLLKIKNVQIQDASLLNLKNRQIDVPLRLVPMIYEVIQKAPVKMDIEQVKVNNVDVVYEELAKKGPHPGKFFLTEMNGVFSGFTNVPTSPNQFIRLDANGKLMDNGYFTATWMLPVDTLNDRFLLNIELNDFDLIHLNNIITPLAPASIKSGYLNHLTVGMDATSIGADINMLFLYKDLTVDILRDNENNHSQNKLYTNFVNLVLLNNNPTYPNRKKAKPREVKVSVIRDPYHSTFNYLWQILRPAVTESVGVSKKKQSFAKKIISVFQKHKSKKAKKKLEKQENN